MSNCDNLVNHVQSHRANGFESRLKRDTARKLESRVNDNEKLEVRNRKQKKTFQVSFVFRPQLIDCHLCRDICLRSPDKLFNVLLTNYDKKFSFFW